MPNNVTGNARDGFKTKRGSRAGKNKKYKKKNALYKLVVTPKPEGVVLATGGVVLTFTTHHHHHHHYHHYHQR
ncbi:hypothetical protein BCR44DRAFT_1424432 [Catenaria anguillulae PL171]|uniref:Uncharacterized protein n=1 Tax=Catenaria anguillulae PL171 TaxID=765915 RepID=A0A1Y2I4W7_9FUNG|nr:hypothetical protein BCR44DRAFT_1424432 [Catenaria anguillulae PL171]